MFLAALLCAGAERTNIRVRNMSATGALLEGTLALERGDRVFVLRGNLIADATVVWTSPGRLGVRFATSQRVKDWLAAQGSIDLGRVDEVIEALLSRADPADTPSKITTQQALQRAESRDLDDVVRLLKGFKDDLTSCNQASNFPKLKIENLELAIAMLESSLNGMAGDISDVGMPDTSGSDNRQLDCSNP
jgi:hypothetical protein